MKKSFIVLIIVFITIALALTSFSASSKKGEREMGNMSSENIKFATFAGGCFWCMEPPFEELPGVSAVISGFTGGHKENPTYNEVVRGGTGHVEAVQVHYDPTRITYNLAVGDLNQDGYLDVAVANSDAQNLVYLNRPLIR